MLLGAQDPVLSEWKTWGCATQATSYLSPFRPGKPGSPLSPLSPRDPGRPSRPGKPIKHMYILVQMSNMWRNSNKCTSSNGLEFTWRSSESGWSLRIGIETKEEDRCVQQGRGREKKKKTAQAVVNYEQYHLPCSLSVLTDLASRPKTKVNQ